MHNLILMGSLLTDSSSTPDLTPIKNLIIAWAGVFLSFVAAIAAVIAVVFIIKNAVGLIKAETGEERKTIKINLIWIVIGFLLCAGGSVIFGVLSNSFFGS